MPLQDYETAAADSHDDLMSCNHTELYQLCNEIGLNPNPAMSKHELIGLILGTRIPETAPNPVNEWRDGIMTFLLNHWRKVSGQLMCPAKTGDKKACYQCLDAQVFQCMSANSNAERNVLEIVKKNHLEKMNMPVATTAANAKRADILTPEEAPRELEKLQKLERGQLVQLIFQTDLKKPETYRAAMKLDDAKLASEIFEALKRWDIANGRSAPRQAQAAAPVATTLEEVPPPARGGRKRTPILETTAQPVTPVTMPAPAAAAPADASELQKALVELSEKLDSQGEEYQQNFKATVDLLNRMDAKIAVLESALYAALSAVLGQSEMHFGISKPDFLELSLADVGDVSSALGKAAQG